MSDFVLSPWSNQGLSLRDAPAPVTVVVPWPRVPVVTPGGKPSKAKRAGQLIPWLSANVVNTLPDAVYRNHKITWREAAEEASDDWCEEFWRGTDPFHPITGPVEVLVKLYKATASRMDPLAVLEGLKPVVDGLEASGLLVNDRLVVGGWAEALKAGSRDECRVEVTLLAVAT
jgi:hypothetical protein